LRHQRCRCAAPASSVFYAGDGGELNWDSFPAFDPAIIEPRPTQAQTTNQNSANFVKDSLPVFLPSWSMPAYMAIQKPAQKQPQQ